MYCREDFSFFSFREFSIDFPKSRCESEGIYRDNVVEFFHIFWTRKMNLKLILKTL